MGFKMMWLHFFGHFGHVDLLFIVTACTDFSVLVVSFIPVCSYSGNGIYTHTQTEKPGDSNLLIYLMKITVFLLAPMPVIFVFLQHKPRQFLDQRTVAMHSLLSTIKGQHLIADMP